MTKRTFAKLEAWRNSKGGTLLFYGYLIAVLVTSCLAFAAYHRGLNADASLRREIAKGQVRDVRSCNAIHGATALWTEELRASRLLEQDTTLPASVRMAEAIRAKALARVVAYAADTPSCGGTS